MFYFMYIGVTWTYRQLRAAMQELGSEPSSSGRRASAPTTEPPLQPQRSFLVFFSRQEDTEGIRPGTLWITFTFAVFKFIKLILPS